MSVTEIDTFVLLFPNEEWTNASTDAQLTVVAQLRPNISFAQTLVDNLETLSTHDADLDGTISGFLYVPDLSKDDACYNISQEYVPANVTRQANLPPTDFTLVAIAPWISVECTFAYMDAASQDPARAFIFFPLNDTMDAPPSASSSFWNLGDGGAWKKKYQYPAYAIPGAIGYDLMHELALYSGNMTDVPWGHQISELPGIDPRDYVRMYTELSVGAVTTLPSLWVFLLAVFAVLFLVLGSTSASMHLIQRARRKSLRRRVASGEVNLEALGIKRLTVPQAFIDRLPLFTYSAEEDITPPSSPSFPRRELQDVADVEDTVASGPKEALVPVLTPVKENTPAALMFLNRTDSNTDSIIVHKFLPYSQPTCPICLDDYVSGESEIRELPCGHIFHPECIDTFLGNNSSLCPMCKRSALPIGFCPTKITNAMVRRERNLRKLRSRVAPPDERGYDLEADSARQRIRALRSKFKHTMLNASRRSGNTSTLPAPPQPVYMTNALPVRPEFVDTYPSSLGPSREEVVARRIEELTHSQLPAVSDPDMVNERHQASWRRILVKAFPGFS